MTKNLSKAIMNKSKAKEKYLNWPSRENFVSYKELKVNVILCNSLTKKAKRDFFQEAAKGGIMTNKKFWRTVKPFLTNNGCTSNHFTSIKNENNLISNEQELWNYLMNII